MSIAQELLVMVENKDWQGAEKLMINCQDLSVSLDDYDKNKFVKVFSQAVINGQENIVKALFDKKALDVKEKAIDGGNEINPLVLVAVYGNLNLLEFLITKGADINFSPEDGEFAGQTLLWFAVYNDDLEMAKLLIKNGANINAAPIAGDDAGQTPLWLAAINDNHEMLDLLIKNGASIGEYLKQIQIMDAMLKIYEALQKNSSILTETQRKDQSIIMANIVLIRSRRYNKAQQLKNGHKKQEEHEHEHDVSVAKESFSKVKDFFQKSNNKVENTQTAFDNAVNSLKQILKSKTKDFDLEKQVANSFDTDDVNHLAWKWLTTFQSQMMLRGDPSMQLVRDMLIYIVACRNDLAKSEPAAAESIENTLILQLSNLMQANQGRMSCAPGTPRGLRVVLDEYLRIRVPGLSSHEAQHILLHNSVFNVINKLMLDIFNKNRPAIVDSKQAENLKNTLRQECDIMAGIGADNIKELLSGVEIFGRAAGEKIELKDLLLRKEKVDQTYPTYESFKLAVIENMQKNPGQKINLTEMDEAYLQQQYVAISNETIRDKLYETLDEQLARINKQVRIINAPSEILAALTAYKDLSNINKVKLKNVLGQAISLLVTDVDLAKRDKVVEDIIQSDTKNFTLDSAKDLFNQLKQRYDSVIMADDAEIKKTNYKP